MGFDKPKFVITPVTRVGQGKQLRSTIRNQTLDLGISLYNATREAGMAQW